eukprot:14131208-Alexandrium_andersonii.AAC.1
MPSLVVMRKTSIRRGSAIPPYSQLRAFFQMLARWAWRKTSNSFSIVRMVSEASSMSVILASIELHPR